MSEAASMEAAPGGLLRRRLGSPTSFPSWRFYVRRHCTENLETWWKGPYLVLLTTLLSTLMRPFVILLFLLTIGTCVTNRLIAFIREPISAVQILMLHQQYQRLGQDSPEYIESEI